jgi:hypothetical protein
VRWWPSIAFVVGCYKPHAPAGVPCDPTAPSCPSGQRCVSEAAGYYCETHEIVDAVPIDIAPDTPPDARLRFAYTATVAECIDPMLPNPDTCKSIKGPDQLVVDMLDATTNQPWDAFVRFDLDSAFGTGAITKLELVLTATSDSLASSGNSGLVYQVMPFTKMDLYMVEPMKVSATPIAPSQGAITQLQVITWPLPTSLASPGGSVFLELESPSQDGANYWNLAGPNPPQLIVTID